jgi:Origin recognition complex subunit 2
MLSQLCYYVVGALNVYYNRNLDGLIVGQSDCDPYKGFLSKAYPDTFTIPRSAGSSGSTTGSLNPVDTRITVDMNNDSVNTSEQYDDIVLDDGVKNTSAPVMKRTIVPVLSTTQTNIDKSKFAKSIWKGRYRYAHPKLYILIDNIEGQALQNRFSQVCLSYLAACDAVSIIATCEHINTPILWSNEVLGRFNWVFEHVPTFEKHDLPRNFILFPSKATISECSNKSSLDSLLTSITVKHRELLELIAKETLAERSNQKISNNNSEGVELSIILSGCKAKLILRTDKELKNMLKELIDQKTVKVSHDCVFMPYALASEVVSKMQKLVI